MRTLVLPIGTLWQPEGEGSSSLWRGWLGQTITDRVFLSTCLLKMARSPTEGGGLIRWNRSDTEYRIRSDTVLNTEWGWVCVRVGGRGTSSCININNKHCDVQFFHVRSWKTGCEWTGFHECAHSNLVLRKSLKEMEVRRLFRMYIYSELLLLRDKTWCKHMYSIVRICFQTITDPGIHSWWRNNFEERTVQMNDKYWISASLGYIFTWVGWKWCLMMSWGDCVLHLHLSSLMW